MKSLTEMYTEVFTEGKKLSFKDIKKRRAKFEKIKKKIKKPKKPKVALDASAIKKFGKKLKANLMNVFSKMKIKEAEETEKVKALAEFLGIDDLEEIETTSWDTYEAEGGEYRVLDDDEADTALREYIEESVWAFNTDFLGYFIDAESLIDYLGLETSYYDEDEEEDVEIEDEDEVVFMSTGGTVEDWIKEQQNKYEDGNDALLEAIGDKIDNFVRDAEMSDGRGHFLSQYDGAEEESGDYYIYRVN